MSIVLRPSVVVDPLPLWVSDAIVGLPLVEESLREGCPRGLGGAHPVPRRLWAWRL